MTPEYFSAWGAGSLFGFIAAVLMLRARRVLSPVTVGALLIALVGCAFGAHWQQRLEYYPHLDALRMSPRELFDPGLRLPLGLVTGAVLAGLWCALFRAPWRKTGDALAVGASVLIPIGRIGCITAGCCMGRA